MEWRNGQSSSYRLTRLGRRGSRRRAKIVAALGAKAVRVDHVGSTSVPGLKAKPIIDIDLSVRDVEDEEDYLPALVAAGYQLRVREPGHRMVRTANLGVHVHCCTMGSDWERRHLLFRDWLRYDQADRVAYGALKSEFAPQDWPDMNTYAEAKSALISEITARAERWAADTSWTVSQARSAPPPAVDSVAFLPGSQRAACSRRTTRTER